MDNPPFLCAVRKKLHIFQKTLSNNSESGHVTKSKVVVAMVDYALNIYTSKVHMIGAWSIVWQQ